MAVSYTEEAKFAMQGTSGGNWGAIMNGVLEALDAGLSLTFEAGEDIAAGNAVSMKITDNKIYKAKSDDLTLMPPLGFAPNAITSGSQGKVRWFGWIDVDTSFSVGASLSFNVGDCVFVDSVAGRIAKKRPKNASLIGIIKQDTDSSFDTRILIHPTLCHNRLTQKASVAIEDLAADADIAAQEIFVHPTSIELLSIGILAQGASAGIDAANTCVIEIQDDAANSIVSKTYNNVTTFPDNDYDDLGALDSTHKILNAGEHLEANITNGTTADPPAFLIIIEYMLRV